MGEEIDKVGAAAAGGGAESYPENIIACYLYVITRYGYPPSAADTEEHLEEYSRLGFRSLELEGIHEDHLKAIHARRQAIRAKAGELDLSIPVFCSVLPGLSSPDPVEREKNLVRFSMGCETARALGAGTVLDNSPLPPWQFPKGIPVTRHYDEEVLKHAVLPANLDWDYYWSGLVETYREVCDISAGHGMTYQLHPCHGALVDTTDAFLYFAAAVKRENLKFNLDTANQYFLKDNLCLSAIRLRDHMDYIHISDNRGAKVEHLAIGDGRIPWDRFFETLDRIGYSGRFGIDIGGAESDVPDLDAAYTGAAGWLMDKWFRHKKSE
jgi:sugar phosphate isomerase/epimerase